MSGLPLKGKDKPSSVGEAGRRYQPDIAAWAAGNESGEK